MLQITDEELAQYSIAREKRDLGDIAAFEAEREKRKSDSVDKSLAERAKGKQKTLDQYKAKSPDEKRRAIEKLVIRHWKATMRATFTDARKVGGKPHDTRSEHALTLAFFIFEKWKAKGFPKRGVVLSIDAFEKKLGRRRRQTLEALALLKNPAKANPEQYAGVGPVIIVTDQGQHANRYEIPGIAAEYENILREFVHWARPGAMSMPPPSCSAESEVRDLVDYAALQIGVKP